ncbi:hypothetical protein ABBQ32_000959 [Trebouxia sp. C0010 RCD-2024]
MWNCIQAKYPQEAAQLSDTAAVIRYDPSFPAQPHQQPHHATDAPGEALLIQATDRQSTSTQATQRQPVLPMRSTLPAESPALQTTGERRSIFSRLTGLALLVPHPLQAHAAQHRQEPVASAIGSSFPSDPISARGALPSPGLPMSHAGGRVATGATVSNTDGAPHQMHGTAGRRGRATMVQHQGQLLHRPPNQPEVLRRAQAAFADLGDARGRLQAQGIF